MIRYFRNTLSNLVYKEEGGKLYFYTCARVLRRAPSLRQRPWWAAGTIKSKDFKPMSEEEVALFMLEN